MENLSFNNENNKNSQENLAPLELETNDSEKNLLSPDTEEIFISIHDSSEEESNIKIEDVILKRDRIVRMSAEIEVRFGKALSEFVEEVIKSPAYTADELDKVALFHVMSGNGVPNYVEHIDLQGEYSFVSFLREFSNKLEEGTL